MASLFGEDNELARELESAVLDVPGANSQQPEEQHEDDNNAEIPEPSQQAQRAFQPLFQHMDHASDAYVTWVSSGNEAVEPGTNDRLRNARSPNDNALVERIYYGYWDTANTLEGNVSPGDIQDVDLQLIGWRLVVNAPPRIPAIEEYRCDGGLLSRYRTSYIRPRLARQASDRPTRDRG